MVLNSLCSDQDTFIFSDFSSALQSLHSTRTDIYINPYILKAKAKYNTFKLKNPHIKLNFYWIPAHLGIRGNEYADQATKRGTQKNMPTT